MALSSGSLNKCDMELDTPHSIKYKTFYFKKYTYTSVATGSYSENAKLLNNIRRQTRIHNIHRWHNIYHNKYMYLAGIRNFG